MTSVLMPYEAQDDDPQEMRRRDILTAAVAVFGAKGFQRSTMKEIAAKAGVAPGTIYLYFENKRDLFIAIADYVISQPMGMKFARAEEMEVDELLASLLRDRMQFARDNRDLLKALAPEIWTDRELQEQFFTRIVSPVLAGGASYLRERIADGSLRECSIDIVGAAIAGSIILLSAFRALVPEHLLADVSDEEIITELSSLCLEGLRRRDGESTA